MGDWVDTEVSTVKSGKNGTGRLTVPSHHGFVVGKMDVRRPTIAASSITSFGDNLDARVPQWVGWKKA